MIDNYIRQINSFWERTEQEMNLKTSSIAIYMALLQINNRCGWKVKFRVSYGQVLSMTGVNVKTYYSCLEELVSGGYIIYEKASNQYQAASFALPVLYQNLDKHGESSGKAVDKHGESTGNILKHINSKTSKSLNHDFESIWDFYDKKVGNKKNIERAWMGLSQEERSAAVAFIPSYKKARPDKQYRKNLDNFINDKTWTDDVITEEKSSFGTELTPIRKPDPMIEASREKIRQSLKNGS